MQKLAGRNRLRGRPQLHGDLETSNLVREKGYVLDIGLKSRGFHLHAIRGGLQGRNVELGSVTVPVMAALPPPWPYAPAANRRIMLPGQIRFSGRGFGSGRTRLQPNSQLRRDPQLPIVRQAESGCRTLRQLLDSARPKASQKLREPLFLAADRSPPGRRDPVSTQQPSPLPPQQRAPAFVRRSKYLIGPMPCQEKTVSRM